MKYTRRFLLAAVLAMAAPCGSPEGLRAQTSRNVRLPFDPRYLLLFAFGIVVIASVPGVAFVGRRSGWRRLAERYPSRNTGRGPSFRSGPVVMTRSIYKAGVRFTTDELHLHFAMPAINRPGHPPFSVPWSDLEASPDEWPWFPFKGEPMIRLTLASEPDLRILVKQRDGMRIAQASGRRLERDLQGGVR
jgi:hypothetical protein